MINRNNLRNREETERKTKGCKDKWMQDFCTKVDKSHQAAKSKEVYLTIKKITRKSSTKMLTVKSKKEHSLTEISEVKDRWKENSEELYKHRNPVNQGFIDHILQMATLEEEPDIMKEEVTSALKNCQMRKHLRQQGRRSQDYP